MGLIKDDKHDNDNMNASTTNPLKRAKVGHHPARSSDPILQQKALLDKLMANPQKVIRTESSYASSDKCPIIPDIVANIPGSSSGASSGQFHIYKHARRRELERLQNFDEQTRAKKADEEWQARREKAKMLDQAKVGKNKKRRDKRKSANGGKKFNVDSGEREIVNYDNVENEENLKVATEKRVTVIVDEDDF
ncbi:hypothetical protein NADFUDRAFT_51423 [Nadsonia fulvescens var. elongata DSM 6958]|uniref:DUF1168-domain-containing protein n=1 Tax=Nadsonia fulvescens var. elongata DSM 6958 TaxID=857566 RepID=A0A1E3PL41_9ASCO|nr:hypothetical protein NADFUDRAFT_51423 [Nadsonia fulvescens var. elongata DSM 6958]